jgi:outer membrane protein assembly factor BamB
VLSDQSAVYGEETSAQTGGVYLVARSVADGVARWRYAISAPGGPIATSAFTVADGVVYLDERQGATPRVVALRADDGTVMWRTPAPDVVSSQATSAQPMSPLVDEAPQVTPTPAPPMTPPPLPTPPPTPTPQGTQEPPVTPTLTPPMTNSRLQAQVTLAADRGEVYVAVSAVPGGALNTIYRFDARSGTVLWRQDFAHAISTPLYTMNGQPSLMLTGDAVYLLDPSGTVTALDARRGSVRWRVSSGTLPYTWSPMPGAIAGGAAPVSGSSSGLLYVATSTCFAINPTDGAVRWSFTPDLPTSPYAPRDYPLTPVISPPTLAP